MFLFSKGDNIGLKRNGCNYHLITIYFFVFFLSTFFIRLHIVQERLVRITNIGIRHLLQKAFFLPLLAVESLY